MSTWTEAIISQWQEWRNADQQDKAVISRSDVITLLVEIERLRDENKRLKVILRKAIHDDSFRWIGEALGALKEGE